MRLPEFKLEEFFAKHEFSAPYILAASDAESRSVTDLIDMADFECKELWDNLCLGYTETHGLPLLRQEISQLYTSLNKSNILVFSGANEAIYISMQCLLEPGDEVIVLTPCYQSLKEVAKAIGARVTEFSLTWDNGKWVFDLEKFSSLVTHNTKLIIINFPHNPTGFLPSQRLFDAIINIANRYSCYLFSDEVYRLSEQNSADCLPNAVDCYEKAISIGVMSKSFGLPGLRIGWIALHDKNLIHKFCSYKNYLSICNSATSEILSIIALRNREKIISRNVSIAKDNLDLLDTFFNKYRIYEWYRPIAGFVSFPRLKLDIDIDNFSEQLITEQGVVIAPGSRFDDFNNHFRLGFGRKNLPEALEHFEQFTKKFI